MVNSSYLKCLFSCFLLTFFLSSPAVSSSATDVIKIPKLSFLPVLDGLHEEWGGFTGIKLHKSHSEVMVSPITVEVSAGHRDGYVFIAMRWPDDTQDTRHSPYVWNDERGRYVASDLKEDRVALQFAMDGDYTPNWLSGNEFVADMWHWKSARSNPLGLAHDKMTIVTRNKMTRSFKAIADDGKPIYIRRPSDSGDKIYDTKRYGLKQSKSMPKYVMNYGAEGSVVDVKARSRWRDGFWYLELKRAMSTGHNDDVEFVSGTSVLGGLAVFNRSSNDNHVISNLLRFDIE